MLLANNIEYIIYFKLILQNEERSNKEGSP